MNNIAFIRLVRPYPADHAVRYAELYALGEWMPQGFFSYHLIETPIVCSQEQLIVIYTIK
jgi:hypothetical protein